LAELLPVEEAQNQILSEFSALPTEQVPVEQSLDHVLAVDIVSPLDLPAYPFSSMDGFAVKAAETVAASRDQPVKLKVVMEIPAGVSPEQSTHPGEAARIMTGAVLPDGADAVIPIEETDALPNQAENATGKKVTLFSPAHVGDYIRPVGQDIRKGELVLKQGRRLLPQDMGVLVTLGFAKVEVYRTPRVALLSTGDELCPPGEPLKPGQIYDTNSIFLAALTERAACQVVRLGIARDDPQVIRAALDQAYAEKVDLIVTTAGVSVGAHDYVRSVIELNGSIKFWRVNMRPGKPIAFGRYRGVPVIGLAGNPVSAFVGFLVFIQPVLQKLSGTATTFPHLVQAVTSHAIESDGRQSYLRAVVSRKPNGFEAALTGHQGSGNLYSLVQANALLIVPPGVKSLPAGVTLNAWLLDDDR
jgi:molybdopterin molybdotransferase